MKRYTFSLVGLLFCIMLAACSLKEVADPIVLPEKSSVSSISVVDGDLTVTCIDDEWIGAILSILADMTPTSTASINDTPGVENYTAIHIASNDGTIKTLFFYEKKGREFVEQPYQGIYKPDPLLGVKLRDMILQASTDGCEK